MRTPLLSMFLGSVAACAALAAEPRIIRDLPQTPVPDAQDQVNINAASQTIDGLIVVVTIDGPNVTLDRAVPARVRRLSRRPTGEGDYAPVSAVGFAAGARIGEATIPDGVMRALDDWNTPHRGALMRFTRRQVVIPIPAPRALDTVEVVAPATGARARLDVRAAYADYCRAGAAARDNPMCPGGDGNQRLR